MKRFISFAALLASVAFVSVPAAAQAAPHWYSNGVLIKEGKKVPIVGWGTLTLKWPVATVTCKDVAAGSVSNGAGGGAGEDLGRVIGWECGSAGCPSPMTVVFAWENAVGPLEPFWPTEAYEESGETHEKWKLRHPGVTCLSGETVVFHMGFEGELTPHFINGNSATHPSFTEFGAGSGSLSSEAGLGEITGKLKIEGYEEQEVITLHNP